MYVYGLDSESGLGVQGNRHKVTATIGLVVHAAGTYLARFSCRFQVACIVIVPYKYVSTQPLEIRFKATLCGHVYPL